MREPVLKFLQSQDGLDTVQVQKRCAWRTTRFTPPDGQTFEWSYAHLKDANGKRVNIIALQEQGTGKILAQLVRGEGTRAEGTSKWSSGNGGQLVLDEDAVSYLSEPAIVATCLMMLKKEIDRGMGAGSSAVVVV